MVKSNETPTSTEIITKNTTEKPTAKSNKAKYSLGLILLAAACGAGYYMWQNPHFINNMRNRFAFNSQSDAYTEQFSKLQNQINQLQTQLNQTNFMIENSGFKEVREQIRNLEKMNLNIIDSKASASAVLGIITRVDAAEQKINNLSEVTDSSALLLTGVMLVKDAADRGQTFEYEAEVLNQIAIDNTQAQKSIKKIQEFSAQGIPSDLELALEFEQLHSSWIANRKNLSQQTWKERINNKLEEIVKIKKTDEPALDFAAEQTLENAASMIKSNDVLRAANLLQKSTEPEIKSAVSIQDWINKVNGREEFYQAISALSADSLASLKVNNLHKVRQHN